MEAAEVVALVLVALLLAGLLYVFNSADHGGPMLPVELMKPWDFPFVPVRPMGCMGFHDVKGKLLNSNIPTVLADTVMGENGLEVPRVLVPRMGKPEGVDKNGTHVNAVTGDYKDCCEYLIQSESRGAAVADGDLCYVFQHISPKKDDAHADVYKAAALDNVFPLWEDINFGMINGPPGFSPLPPATGEQHVTYMIACGGEGNIPCMPNVCDGELDCTSKDYLAPGNPPGEWGARSGCSQLGDEGRVPLFRTTMESQLPYSDTRQYQICQTGDYIRWFGYNPSLKAWGREDLPSFNKHTGENSRYMMDTEIW